MFQKLVSHNADLRRLVEEGYAIAFDGGFLVVRDIPYLDANRQLQVGALVAKLEFLDNENVRPNDHQVFFAGSAPCSMEGSPVPNLGGGTTTLMLSDASKDVVIQRSFSNKPRSTGTFRDFYDKITSYVAIISGPAMQLFPEATPLTYRADSTVVEDTTFKFHDTLTSRAEIGELSARFRDDVVAVIGLGGTGSYLLDFLVRTPVKEIRAFDHDSYLVHDMFRSPGKVDATELGRTKADVYSARYKEFRHGLSIRTKFIDESSTLDFEGVTFAFVCVDNGPSRAGIFDLLMSGGIPFIDVGMGLRKKQGLNGMMRMTYYPLPEATRIRDKGLAELSGANEDAYRANIQIGELNALNACLAIIRFKQLRGFYDVDEPYYHLLFRISDLRTVGYSNIDAD